MPSYFERLRGVRDEYDAASAALRMLTVNWARGQITTPVPTTPRYVRIALQNLEMTYFLRLHAEYESILRDEIFSADRSVGDDLRVRVLERRALRGRKLSRRSVDPTSTLFERLDLIHQHRNRVAHGNTVTAIVTFQDALTTFNTFLARLG